LLAYVYGKLRKEYSILIIGFLVLIDLWSAGKRYLDSSRFERMRSFSPTAADNAILQDKSYYRVLNLSASVFNDNTPTSWFHKSIGGYHGAKLKRYQELIDSAIIRELTLFSRASEKATSFNDFLPLFGQTPALNMLNARYVILDPQAAPLVNTHALGNAWFADKPVFAENANAELAFVNDIDPAREAAIDVRFRNLVLKASYQPAPGDSIRLVSYEPNELIYKYNSASEAMAIFSEIYYPAGWKCYIDGKETPYFRADYVLRGAVVPAGSHELRFAFRPASYFTGNKISLASSIILILMTAGYLGSRLIRKD
jgi:hypothetical protein